MWPLKTYSKPRYYDIVHSTLKQLDKPDLIGKVRIFKSNDTVYQSIYANYKYEGCCNVIALVPYFQRQPILNRIVLFRDFFNITSEKIKEEVIRHEVTHIVDVHNRSADFDTGKAQPHDEIWKKLMNKINCRHYSVDIVNITRRIKNPTLRSYKYYNGFLVNKPKRKLIKT